MENSGKRALVISSGGAKGSWGGGVSEHLVKKQGKKYDLFVGSSTGNLLSGLVALEEFDQLKIAYTSITQDDIFSVNPFKIKYGINGSPKVGVNYLNILYNTLIRKRNSLGDSSVLRKKTIPKFFTEEMFNELKKNNKEIVSCVTNATLGVTEYKSSFDFEYDEFLDWMYASSCAPPFMSIVKKGKYEYTDGGLLEHIPIQYAIDNGATEVDVISLRTEKDEYPVELIRNPLHWVNRIISLLTLQISLDDVNVGVVKAANKNVKINIYYTPKKLTNNSLIFDSTEMSKWWDEGYDYAESKI